MGSSLTGNYSGKRQKQTVGDKQCQSLSEPDFRWVLSLHLLYKTLIKEMKQRIFRRTNQGLFIHSIETSCVQELIDSFVR
ncbi:MAG: hypothetical protein A2066_21540 [Bacteroidetes bacterium GWB2_41_8]|nr:MAG: hypothetical protein A2066_21540 [Bacteroidetes bacterium GWB2_41_8]